MLLAVYRIEEKPLGGSEVFYGMHENRAEAVSAIPRITSTQAKAWETFWPRSAARIRVSRNIIGRIRRFFSSSSSSSQAEVKGP